MLVQLKPHICSASKLKNILICDHEIGNIRDRLQELGMKQIVKDAACPNGR